MMDYFFKCKQTDNRNMIILIRFRFYVGNISYAVYSRLGSVYIVLIFEFVASVFVDPLSTHLNPTVRFIHLVDRTLSASYKSESPPLPFASTPSPERNNTV